MSSMSAMIRKDFREMLRSPSTYTGPVLLATYTAMVISVTIMNVNDLLADQRPLDEAAALLQKEVNADIVILAMLAILGMALGVATTSVLLEKKERKLESLLATPVSLAQLWRSKTLGIAVVCIPLGMLFSLGTPCALCYWVVNPRMGLVIWPEPLPLLAALLIVPAAMYCLLDIYVGLQFVISNHRFSNILFLVLLSGAVGLNILFIETEESALRYVLLAAAAGVFWLAGRWLATFVTTERVMLSSKG